MTEKKTGDNRSLDREIVKLTLPTVLSNISVPLLGLCDTAVAGHMGDERYLAGIAIGSVMVTTMYWLFSFLRAGTSGLTAAAFGAGNKERMGYALLRSTLLGLFIGVIILAVHVPALRLLHLAMGASPDVTLLSGKYFSICILGAVPMMLLTALSGWFVGMQSTSKAMVVNIGVSILNVVLTLTLVYGFGFGFEGIAAGTVLAQWLILIPAIWIAVKLCRKHGISLGFNRKVFFNPSEWRLMFGVNSNLFFRSACLIAATMVMYAYSARLGDVEVGANAVINQLFLFFSYFMDGFAYTGEAMIGRYYGAGAYDLLRASVKSLIKWGACVTLIFCLAYAFALPYIVSLLSDSKEVVACVIECRVWVVAIPLVGVGAFLYDGFYIGIAKTAPMLISTLCGVILFILLLTIIDYDQWMLWMSFTCYLTLRSVILIVLFKRTLRKDIKKY